MRSKFEEQVAENLKAESIDFEYELFQLEYYIKCRSTTCFECGSTSDIWTSHWYTPDFYLPEYDMYIEAKGYWKAQDRKKHEALKRDQSDSLILFNFMYDNKIHKNSDMRYSEWCDKREIPYVFTQRGVTKELLKDLSCLRD